VSNDTEVWLLFAPFWLLGIAALIGSVWHFAHFAIVHAQAAGHVRKTSLFSKRLGWHELTDAGRHHLKRALISFAAFFALCLLGVGAGVAADCCSAASDSLIGHQGHDLVVAGRGLGDQDLLVAGAQRHGQNSQ